MTTFQEKLIQLKKNIEGKMPSEYVQTMHKATADLKASNIEEKVIKVGNSLPNFELPNQDEKIVSAQELYQDKFLVITFYRGVWCPYCNADLANLNKYLPQIEELGGTMVAISPEKTSYLQKIIKTQNLNFDILHDQSNQFAQKLGLKFKMPDSLIELYRDKFKIDLEEHHGDKDWTLPMPARFLVDKNGITRYAESNADYTQRPNPEELIEVLKTL
ncbi:peroxiredoxin-like family protein [Bernardetia sp.]|uniref:peroxiredoxin-like family protein n=1 Tax=Bernardetia sp. TaxID=1937974 RepID=UPI0025BF92E3|nr:peroxiredoxin-like family protein [Bernardetia sp.]